jgi:hypothetical protein
VSKFEDGFEIVLGAGSALLLFKVAGKMLEIVRFNMTEANRLRVENPDQLDEAFLSRIRHLGYGDERGEKVLGSIYLTPQDVHRIRAKWLFSSLPPAPLPSPRPNRKLCGLPLISGRRSHVCKPPKLVQAATPVKQLVSAPVIEPVKKQRGGRAKSTINRDTLKTLSVYIRFRDERSGDETARLKTVQDMRPVPLAAKRTRAALDRAIKRWLNNGDYSEQQARRFRKL